MIMKTLTLKTEPGKFYVITDKIEELVRESGVEEGLCVLFIPSTTSFILLQENCELLKEDLEKTFEKLAPREKIYSHPDNAHSHILASVFGNQRIIPIKNSSLAFGTWQDIIFYEADTKPRERKINVVIIPLEEEE